MWRHGRGRTGPAKQAQVAAALGYSLSAFLALGRGLAESEALKAKPKPPPPSVPAWLIPLLPDLANFNEAGQKALRVLVKVLRDNAGK